MEDYSSEVMQNIQTQVEAWCDAFAEASLFKNLAENVQEEARFITSVFSEYMYNYHLETPDKWSSPSLTETICDLFPRKISADRNMFKAVEPVLSAFFQYLNDMGHISNSSALIKSLKKSVPVMLKQSNDSTNWGPAKQFVMNAMQSGVDLQDEQALRKFTDSFNAGMRQIPTSATPRAGRNELCPCGSGKKYKRCCGE